MANNIDFRVKNGLVVSSTATFQSLAGSTSTTTGALTVTGGVGIGENLYVGRALYVSGSKVVTEATAGGVASLNALTGTVTISVGTDTASYVNTGTKDILIWNTSTLQTITSRGSTTSNAISITSTASSTGTNTGALTVTGGVGIGGTMYVGGVVNITNTATSISTSSGALIVVGGVGVGGSITAARFIPTSSTIPIQGMYYKSLNVLGFAVNSTAIANLSSYGMSIGLTLNSTNSLLEVNPTSGTNFSIGSPNATNALGIYNSGGTWAPGYGIVSNINANSLRSLTVDLYDGIDTGSVNTASTLYIEGAPIGSSNGATTAITNPYALYVNSGASYLGGTLKISSTTPSTSTTTGALQVAGGVGIGGSLYIGNTVRIQSTVTSTGTTTGALVVTGGVGIGGSLYIGNTVRIQSTVTSTGTTTGALVVTGGVGIGGSVYIANTSYINGAEIVTTATIGNYAAAGGGVGVSGTGTTSTFIIQNYTSATSTNSGALQVWGGAGIGGNLYVGGNIVTLINQYVAFGGNTSTRITRDGTLNGLDLQTAAVSRLFIADTDGAVTIRSTATSAATTNGSLVVVGGVGIGGNLNVGGTTSSFIGSISAQGTGNFGLGSNGLVTLGAGTDGSIELGAASRTTAGTPFIDFHSSINSNDYDSRIIASGGTGTTTGTGNLTIVASQFIIQGTATSTSTSSGALQVRGGVGIGGAAWIGTTSYVAGSQILTEANLSGFGVSRIFAGTDTAINTSTGAVTIWDTSTLQSVTSRGSSTNQVITITNTSSSTGTSTGALRVTGGVGIGGNVYIGRTSYIDGAQIITSATISTFQSLKGQYIPRTANVATNSLVSVIPGLYDSYVVTAQGGTIVFQIDSTGYTPFDGQKLLIRIYDTTPSNLSWTYGSAQFRTVGISPPQITGNGTIYIGIMYNQTVNQWDILSAVIQ